MISSPGIVKKSVSRGIRRSTRPPSLVRVVGCFENVSSGMQHEALLPVLAVPESRGSSIPATGVHVGSSNGNTVLYGLNADDYAIWCLFFYVSRNVLRTLSSELSLRS